MSSTSSPAVLTEADILEEYEPNNWGLAYPDRVWRDAQELSREPGPPDGDWSPWATRAARYLRLVARNGPDAPVDLELRDVAAAIKLRRDSKFEADVLEARLLAGETTEEIARRSGLDYETQLAYEILFFQFRRRRESPEWLADHVFQRPGMPEQPVDLGVVVKRLGYGGGPVVLERLLETVVRLSGKTLLDELPDATTAAGRLELETRCVLALELLPRTPLADRVIMLLQTREMAARAAGRRSADSPDELLRRLATLCVGSVPCGKLKPGRKPRPARLRVQLAG